MNGLKLTLTAILIAINAFFVIAEYALVRSRRARLELMRELRSHEIETVIVGPMPHRSRMLRFLAALLGRKPEQQGGVDVWYGT